VTNDGRGDLAALQKRGADLYILALANEEHLAEFDRCTRLRIELLDTKDTVLRDTILFTARGDDRIHGGILKRKGRKPKGRAFY
jgi:hypothetical protein